MSSITSNTSEENACETGNTSNGSMRAYSSGVASLGILISQNTGWSSSSSTTWAAFTDDNGIPWAVRLPIAQIVWGRTLGSSKLVALKTNFISSSNTADWSIVNSWLSNGLCSLPFGLYSNMTKSGKSSSIKVDSKTLPGSSSSTL